MHFAMIGRVLGLLLMGFSFTMLAPVGISWWYQDNNYAAFFISFGITFAFGLMIWLPFMRTQAELQTRDGFFVVTLYWLVLGIVGSLPILLTLDISPVDAVFESVSGLTTTGATVLTGLDEMPKSLLFYRQQLNWLGGMGVIVLAIAILPMLGIGGMQLYKAEIPGPMKDAKLTPRIAETAKALWFIYVLLTVVCAIAFNLAGMGWFDAVSYSFATLATGGFAPHDASLGFYHSGTINVIAAVFIFLAATNFALFFSAWQRRSLVVFLRDPEFRFFVGLQIIYIAAVTISLLSHGTYTDSREALHQAALQVLSLSTGCGFTSAPINNWPAFISILLVLSSFIGGCAGSTGGGMKVVRSALIFSHSQRELRRLIYPSGIFPLRFGRHTVQDQVLQAVWGFVGVYITISVLSVLALMASEVDFTTAVSAVAATINTMGAGIGGVANGFGGLPDISKLVLTFDMLLGRLEVFTILVLFTRMFWRQ